jgi:hypothetical protein
MSGAAYGLGERRLLVLSNREHPRSKMLEVAALDPNIFSQDPRRLHLFIAIASSNARERSPKRTEERAAARVPKHSAWRLLLKMKEVQILAYLSMVICG